MKSVCALFCFFAITAMVVSAIKLRNDCECGNGNMLELDLRIISGTVVQPNAYPWVVYMRYHGRAYCGGAVINDRYILTAAHCVWNLSPKGITVVVGAHDSHLRDGLEVPIDDYVMHNKYKRHANHDNNDIAVIKLKQPLQFNRNVTPICLPHPDSEYTNAIAIVAGWGTTENKTQSRYLLESRLRVISDSACLRSVKIGDKFVPGENICAYGYDTDSCQGDSGSPLIYESSPYKYEMLGVVSWGEGCAPRYVPGVYAKVTNYLQWIASQTSDAEYCKPF